MTQNRSTAVIVISRIDALAIGQRWYFTGEPCLHGHIAKRSCSNRDCRSCVDARTRARRAADPEPFREREKRTRDKAPDVFRKRARDQRAKHLDKRLAYDRERYNQQPGRKEWQKRQAVEWGRVNKGKRNFLVTRRRSGIEAATPKWLTAEQQNEIRSFYIRAREMGPGFQVDHIVPLRGNGVCGLHVPWNLQILTKAENIAKGNRYEA